jgi:hypothetical protein
MNIIHFEAVGALKDIKDSSIIFFFFFGKMVHAFLKG